MVVKMKIYIDVSNLMHVNFISGIQRVVREVVLRMLAEPDFELMLLVFDERDRQLHVLDNEAFRAYFQEGQGSKEDILGNQKSGGKKAGVQRMEDFKPGEIWFEIDSVWHSKCKRMDLYPQLKGRGVKIAVCFQDIIPIMWPQYADRMTRAAFAGYMAACITHGDLFISSTQTNLDYLKALMQQTGVENNAPCHVSWLGVDFKANTGGKVRKSVQEAAEGGKYVLMVGTVEPRKNHSLILEAFEKALFEKGYRLIIAGRIGWNVKELEQRIRKHPCLNKEFIFIEDANDAEIEYLYQKSFLVAFPSRTEGFGLPIVEALGRGIPVISSDHPVMREVGGEWCEYVSATDAEDFISCVEKYGNNDGLYQAWKRKIADYEPCSWNTVEANIAASLRTLQAVKGGATTDIRQMVILSARAEDFLRSLPFIEHFMPFIKELVLCCPDAMEAEVKAAYKGRLYIHYLTDSLVLAGAPLPKDHAARNIFLRAKAIEHAIIDEVFLMGDDDYRPLREISKEMYVADGKYIGYYMHDLKEWHGTQGGLTSFDVSMLKCRDFLSEQGYPTYMFDAHMPQVIEKQVFLEMMDRHPEISAGAASEWSGYFNYLAAHYPDKLQIKPYVTMGWPGHLQDWDTDVTCEDFLFENFYEDVYEEQDAYGNPGHFKGFSREFFEGIEAENLQKAEILRGEYAAHEKALETYRTWQEDYRRQYGKEPVFAVYTKEKEVGMAVPEQFTMLADSFLRIRFAVLAEGRTAQEAADGTAAERRATAHTATAQEEWQMTFGIYEGDRLVSSMGSSRFMTGERLFNVLLVAPKQPGNYRLEWNLFAGKRKVHETMELKAEE